MLFSRRQLHFVRRGPETGLWEVVGGPSADGSCGGPRRPPRIEGEHSKCSSASGEALEGATLERMRLTVLCHGCGNCPVLPERLRHLIKAKRHDETNEQEGDSEDAAPSVKSAKDKT